MKKHYSLFSFVTLNKDKTSKNRTLNNSFDSSILSIEPLKKYPDLIIKQNSKTIKNKMPRFNNSLQKFENKKKKIYDNYLNFSFKPKINKKSKSLVSFMNDRNLTIYERSKKWNERKKLKLELIRKSSEERKKKTEQFSFIPTNFIINENFENEFNEKKSILNDQATINYFERIYRFKLYNISPKEFYKRKFEKYLTSINNVKDLSIDDYNKCKNYIHNELLKYESNINDDE
jgi:hypothetical protein